MTGRLCGNSRQVNGLGSSSKKQRETSLNYTYRTLPEVSPQLTITVTVQTLTELDFNQREFTDYNKVHSLNISFFTVDTEDISGLLSALLDHLLFNTKEMHQCWY